MSHGGSGLLPAALIAVGLAAACTGPAPGSVTFTEGTVDGTESSNGGGTDGGPKKGNSTLPGDSFPGADAGTAASDPVFKGEDFAFVKPAKIADEHIDGTHAGQVPLEGKDCLTASCHIAGGTMPWAFAGTVYAAATGGATIAQAEVRVVSADGTEVGRAYTDANGNFWLAAAGAIPAGSKVGVRTAKTNVKLMGATFSSGGCNATAGCHGSNTLRIFIPG